MKRGWLASVLLGALLLGGCAWPVHARQLQDLQPVQTLGFDGGPGAVTVSVSDRRSTREESAVRMAARGESLVRACEELQNFAPRGELFFAHARYALVGEAAAREGLSEVLDWFSRSTQTRLRLPLFLVRGAEARELVTGSEDDDYEITALLSALEERTERRGELHCYTVLDTIRALNDRGAALCCALRPQETGENAPSAAEGALTALAVGYGVLKGDSLQGWLTEAEARGATILLNDAGEISYALPEGESGAAVTLRSAKTRWVRGETLLAEVRLRAGLTELWGPGELTEERLHALERQLSALVAAECAGALEVSKRLEADFLGLGLGEEALGALSFRVQVTAEITRSYDTAGGPVEKEASHGK